MWTRLEFADFERGTSWEPIKQSVVLQPATDNVCDEPGKLLATHKMLTKDLQRSFIHQEAASTPMTLPS